MLALAVALRSPNLSINSRRYHSKVTLTMKAAFLGLAYFVTPGSSFIARPMLWPAASRVAASNAANKEWRVAEIDEWDTDISAIASRYLQGKYENCNVDDDNCRAVCDRNDITTVSLARSYIMCAFTRQPPQPLV